MTWKTNINYEGAVEIVLIELLIRFIVSSFPINSIIVNKSGPKLPPTIARRKTFNIVPKFCASEVINSEVASFIDNARQP
jgi:hypothetical protein